ncbi:MAG: radical SAM protein, partial [candidate division Zixibacteria bacterium]|nr:radical SAM protein [candidate division Zixibacteria bacterium]NIR65900.1 radical SAM protein [candidate division Zixibacteria bacterium]NIS47549.1 radical SAM protein [candidate division Zixibacteria bacterium]NIU15192.1 radical SAM protein [candidate division Zixibacteria bacterium]NIV07796.1 radical SAM protein [candidate division Zixibacteria bacterium]
MAKKIVFTERLTTFYKYPSVCLYQDKIEDTAEYMSFLNTPSTQLRQQMIYIHIPFCASMCLYCPFYKVNFNQQDKETIERVVDCISLELKKYADTPFFKDVPIVNVHIGGGTPMILEPRHFEKIFTTIRDGYNMEQCEVISIEGDPFTLQDGDKLKALKEMGMTRCSFGMQTFNERLRKKLGIRSSLRDVYKAVDTIRRSDIQEFACDVLYNLPDQNVNEIRYNIDRVCEMEPNGVDFYDLNLLPNTKLQKLI